jgi:AraC-like DNA-binding protein
LASPSSRPTPDHPAPRRAGRATASSGTDLSLAEIASRAGFMDQSQFSRHFKRLVGVTPGQFRMPARIV